MYVRNIKLSLEEQEKTVNEFKAKGAKPYFQKLCTGNVAKHQSVFITSSSL